MPIGHSERLETALRKAGVPVEFVRVRGGGHGMKEPPGQPPPAPDVETLCRKVGVFFDQHLKK